VQQLLQRRHSGLDGMSFSPCHDRRDADAMVGWETSPTLIVQVASRRTWRGSHIAANAFRTRQCCQVCKFVDNAGHHGGWRLAPIAVIFEALDNGVRVRVLVAEGTKRPL
jgi:hypothetical protein